MDGSLTNLGPRTWAVPNYPHLEQPECKVDLDVMGGIVCDRTAQLRRVVFYNGGPSRDFTGMHMKVLKYDDKQLPTEEAALETHLKDKKKYSSFE